MHGSDVFMAEKNRAFGAAARRAFESAAWITACSDDLMQRALALGADESKTELIPYGADAKAFHVEAGEAERVRAQLGLGRDDVMILAVGRMVYKKGFEFLVSAMPGILQRAPSVRLVLVGYGDLRKELEDRAHSLGLNGHVTFAGQVPRPEIPGREYGGICTSHREVWKPGSDLPGLRRHHEPAGQPGQDRPNTRRNGHQLSASTGAYS
jgi:glycosyltransferase involved in cell wall biosynthesis